MNKLCCWEFSRNTTEDVRSLDYSHTLLNDVPSEIYVYERTLEKLYLDSNRILELPKQLFNCDELRILSLSDNEIDFLPPAISQLVNLQKFDLSKNAITKIPENIKSCSCLCVLDLSINPIDKFPESLINTLSLKELYLNDVYLEFLPANFGKLVNIRILELRENNLSALPRTISRLVHLTRLDIGNNEFDELPEIVSSLQNLTELWIDGNNIRKLNQSIGQLRKLVHFEGSNNKIELLPSDVGHWTKIVEFSLSCNEISTLPTSICNMKSLVTLKLDENHLTQLPETIGKLSNLEELMINYNYLSKIPACIGLLRKLQVLIVDRNKLSEIPPEIGSCSSLSILSLRDNCIGEMPAEIGHINSLRVLNLVNNQLKYLPMSLLKLDKLSALWLSNNQSQPLVPLQQELCANSHQLVLTCFMLPQISYKRTEHPKVVINNRPNQTQHKRICFASDSSKIAEHTQRLMRAPTPYPKELRALAKNAKNVQRGIMITQQNNEKNAGVTSTIEIKEAKVSTMVTNIPQNIEHIKQTNKNISSDVQIADFDSTLQSSDVHSLSLSDNKYMGNANSSDGSIVSLSVLTAKNNPVIRKAKNIRTEMQNKSIQNTSLDLPKTSFTSISTSEDLKNEFNFAQPPPYHVAATRSQYFNSLDCNECVQLKKPKDNINYNKYSIKQDYSEHCTYDRDHLPLTSNTQNLNIEAKNYNNSCSHYEDVKTVYNENVFSYTMQNQNDYKPRTFIQDKPTPSEYIVVPTPKRPISTQDSQGFKFYEEMSNETRPKNGDDTIVDGPSQNGCKYIEKEREVINNENSSNGPTSSTIKWAFGPHKNVTVMQVTFKKTDELGFTISEKQGYGIHVDSVISGSPASHMLRVGDKILEVDGVDFTNMNKSSAVNILQQSSNIISMMISHIS